MLKKLRASYPKYDKAMTMIHIDWDTFKRHPVTTSRKVPRRSTLILIKGGKEVVRLVAQTSERDIKALLDKAL